MHTPRSFHIIVKPFGPICNLNCEYCYYLHKSELYPESNFRMSYEVLEKFTQEYIRDQVAPEINFAWQGGEPTLLGIEFFRKALEFQEKYKKEGIRISNSLQTNATVLDDELCVFFAENNFLLGVSLDGPKEFHDLYRKDKNGNPTFERVIEGIKMLNKHKVEYNILCCINSANEKYPLEVYRFFRDKLKVNFIQFIPIVEINDKADSKETIISSRSVSPEQFGNFLNTVFDEWVYNDVGNIYVQHFDSALGSWNQYPGSICVFSRTCGYSLAMEHNGDLYSCDHFVYPEFKIGNIMENSLIDLVSGEKQYKFGQDKYNKLHDDCLKCEFQFVCNGACPKNRIQSTPDDEFGKNYLCKGYKIFFNHIDRYMKIMSSLLQEQKPPSMIMNILRSSHKEN